MDDRRARARELANDYLARGDSLGWFEHLYAEAFAASGGDMAKVPWADSEPNPNLIEWIKQNELDRVSALVVGCGLGDDAEYLAHQGFQVTAFDISKTAIAWCRQRFPESKVMYEAHDLFQAPENWKHCFQFIFEAYTLQVLPAELRRKAMSCIGDWVSLGGTLLAVARARDTGEPIAEHSPWPLTKEEFATFNQAGPLTRAFEDYFDSEEPPVRRFRATYQRVGLARGQNR
jgi:SAM-dependent methyltransferase